MILDCIELDAFVPRIFHTGQISTRKANRETHEKTLKREQIIRVFSQIYPNNPRNLSRPSLGEGGSAVSAEFSMSRAGHQMIVNHADGLHEGITDR